MKLQTRFRTLPHAFSTESTLRTGRGPTGGHCQTYQRITKQEMDDTLPDTRYFNMKKFSTKIFFKKMLHSLE